LIRAGVSAVKEPPGLLTGSGIRPDGTTLIPSTRGKCLAWDATSPDTIAASHLPSTRNTSGAATAHAADVKLQKYAALQATHVVVPVAVETMGSWCEEGLEFMRELGRRTSMVTNDP
jgi:hypothetical protein